MSLAATRTFTEKRDFIRMQMRSEAWLSTAEGDSPIKVICNNLSATGMHLTCDQDFTVNSEMHVTLPSTHETVSSLTAKVRILRSEPTESGEEFHIAVEILSISG